MALGSAWQKCSRNRDEAPTFEDRRIIGAGDVGRVGESALRLLKTSCGWPSRLGSGTVCVPDVQRLVALC